MVTSVHVLVFSRGGERVFEGRGGVEFIHEVDMSAVPEETRHRVPRAQRLATRHRRAARRHRDRVRSLPDAARGMRPRSAALALALLWVAGCAGPPVRRTSLDGWQTVETRGVRIVAEASAEELDALAGDLSGFHAAFSFLLGREITSTGPTTIALVRDSALAGRIGLGQGHGGLCVDDVRWSVRLCSAAIPTGSRPGSTLFHEYTHLLLWRHRSALIPRWYTEGLADYFSTVAFRDGALVVGALPAGRLDWLVQRRHPMPLDLLFGGDRDETLRGTAIGDFYATAWALTHYLLSSPKGARRAVALREGARERHAARRGAQSRVRALVRAPDRGAHDPRRLSRARRRRRERARPAQGPRHRSRHRPRRCGGARWPVRSDRSRWR